VLHLDGAEQRTVLSTATTTTPKTTPNRNLSPEAAVALSSQLRSGRADQVRQAVVLPQGTSPPARFVTGLHRLKALTFDTTTFRDNGDGTAQVQAEVTGAGQRVQMWTAYLVWESNTWKLSATMPSTTGSVSP